MHSWMKKLLICLAGMILLCGALMAGGTTSAAAEPARGPMYGHKDICVWLPYYGSSRDVFHHSASLGEMLANYTGGTLKVYKGSEATIANLAKAMETCAVVIIGSHGLDGAFGVQDTGELTEEEKKSDHVETEWETVDKVTYFGIDGTVITDHMTDIAPHSLVVMECCQGVKSERTTAPLLAHGVSAVMGNSETTTCFSNWAMESAFFRHLCEADNVAQAFTKMQEEAGLWDVVYTGYTLEQALKYAVAFPNIISEEDEYPGVGHVNRVQTVNSGWRLPVRTDVPQKLTVPLNEPFGPKVIDINCKTAKIKGGGKLQEGVYYGVTSDGLLYLQGTATEQGYHVVTFEIVTKDGHTLSKPVAVMAADYAHATVKPAVELNFTTESKANWDDSYVITNTPSAYEALLDFHSDSVSTYTIERHSGSLPYSLEFGKTEHQGEGYIKPALAKGVYGYDGYHYSTAPGQYNITLDLITYPAGKVYRLPVQITYTAANTQNVSHTLNFQQNVKVRYQLDELRMENYNISGIELTEGRLPDGLMLANAPLNKFGLYGTPTESGSFTAKYRVTAFNHIYNYTINVTVDKSFTVSFDPNGGSGSMEDAVVPENSPYTLPECKFTAPDGKAFKGWDYGAPGEKLTESMDRDYTVKALWEDSLIRDVRISGLKIPVAGELGCTVADLSVPAGVHYHIEEIEWISMNSEAEGTFLNPSHPFETGHTYYATIKVKADDGYEFWCDGSGKADLDVITLNGEAALVQYVNAYEPERLTVLSQDYALAVPENIIRDVQVTGLVLPVAGEGAVSADQLSVQAGAHYKVIGLKWYDAATGTEVELPFQFENGKSYFARMDVRVELGYAFPFDGTMNPGFDSFTVNGDTSLQNSLIMLGNRIARLETVVFDAAPAATTYAFTKGAGGTWTKGTEDSLKFTVKGSPDDTDTFMKFGGIEVDGTEVPTDGYTASAGSVNISLKASWLNSLSEGAHQLKVSLKDGSAETSFTVAAGKKQPDVPKTGDNANLLLWLGMVLLGLLGICGLSVVRNRK